MTEAAIPSHSQYSEVPLVPRVWVLTPVTKKGVRIYRRFDSILDRDNSEWA